MMWHYVKKFLRTQHEEGMHIAMSRTHRFVHSWLREQSRRMRRFGSAASADRMLDKIPGMAPVDDVYAAYKSCELDSDYTPHTLLTPLADDIKFIAFYLPQFHPFEENNTFHGRGFTEWTQVTKARPLFRGHYQPRLPGELGFYDTRVPAVMERQAEMAKQYGIYGFCLHHYFFSGRKVMRVPFNNILNNKQLDFKFCLHWANESWTRTWDGVDKKGSTLLQQRHNHEDDIAFFEDILPAITDDRYITVAGRPMLLIYRPSLFPDMKKTLETWKNLCIRHGVRELYAVVMQTAFDGQVEPSAYGFDAAIEYGAHLFGDQDPTAKMEYFDPDSPVAMIDYRNVIHRALAREKPDYTLFRGINADLDPTPRKVPAAIWRHATPENFRRWIDGIGRYTMDNLPPDKRFVFVNAWNEWAEGAYLEPDRKRGYGYLRQIAGFQHDAARQKTPQSRLAITMHLHYLDVVPEILSRLADIPEPFDLFVTTTHFEIGELEQSLRTALGARVGNISIIFPGINAGFDIGPFVTRVLGAIQGYDIACHVHTKKSLYNPSLAGWRSYLLQMLFGSPEQIRDICDLFRTDETLGLVMAPHYPEVSGKIQWSSNYATAASIATRLGFTLEKATPPLFPSGFMFWFRPKALASLLRLDFTLRDFLRPGVLHEEAGYDIDGTLAHAIERIIGKCCEQEGFRVHVINVRPDRENDDV
jgi:lipopolysaccharide biosynthesis protein